RCGCGVKKQTVEVVRCYLFDLLAEVRINSHLVLQFGNPKDFDSVALFTLVEPIVAEGSVKCQKSNFDLVEIFNIQFSQKHYRFSPLCLQRRL
ncbi:hypothetical protein NPIL_319281, partial [Nephila pilipes]